MDLTLPPQTLTVTATSSDQKILPDSNILLQGSGNNRTFTVFPVGTFNGDVQLTFSVSDGIRHHFPEFHFGRLAPRQPAVRELGSISVPANDVSVPYPSTISVSNLLGTVSKVGVTLFDISHSAPDNLNVLLVSPSGTKVLLMGHAGGANALGNTTIEFSDTASGPLPDNAPISSGTYQPSSYGTVASFPSVPAGVDQLTLGRFQWLERDQRQWSVVVIHHG